MLESITSMLSTADSSSALFSVIVRVISVVTILGFIFPIQLRSILESPKDGLYVLRLIIITFLLLYVTLSMPAIAHQYLKATGTNITELANLASICSNLGYFSVTIWLVLLYTYQDKEKKGNDSTKK